MAKQSKATKSYVSANGESVRTVSADAQTILFAFTNGDKVIVEPDSLPDNIKRCAMFHGLGQKIGDSYAGIESVADAAEEAESLLERLISGEWMGERESSGPRVAHIIEAMVMVRQVAGKPFSEAEVADRTAKLKTDATYRKSVLANKQVAAEIAKAAAARAAERAAQAAAAATGATDTENL